MNQLFNENIVSIFNHWLEIIIALIIIWVTLKVYRFWTLDKTFSNVDDQRINPKITDYNTYEPGTILPPYPNLWYPIIRSKDLKPGRVKPLYVIGQDLAAFRTSSGKVHILNAFCPHLGAHLGEGSVEGEDVRCPFHSWTFNGDGICTSVPGLPATANIPKTKVKTWKSIERNGWVYVWHHINDEEPTWEPPEIEQLKGLGYFGEFRGFTNSHLFDVLVNPFDAMHYDLYHSVLSSRVSEKEYLRKGKLYQFYFKLFHLNWEDMKFEIGEDETDKQVSYVRSNVIPVLFGHRCTSYVIDTTIVVRLPSYLFIHHIPKLNITGHYFLKFIPIGPMRQIVSFEIYQGTAFLSKLLARILLHRIPKLAGPENVMLNNKRFVINPLYTALDKPQAKFYRWFKDNFYSLD